MQEFRNPQITIVTGEPQKMNGGAGGGDYGGRGGVGRFYGWPSSRIVRVSRASGGKDRHSKVLTSKGLRDRRVRLSVNTAIQFYDLQDRLGYDQPSKAVEWLLKAAASSITELPPINSPLFPDTPNQVSDEKPSMGSGGTGSDHFELEDDNGGNPDPDPENDPNLQMAKSSAACSSNSENSKGSGLSLSRSDERVSNNNQEKKMRNKSLNPISHATSFTELLGGGGGAPNESNLSPPRQWSDYFTGLFNGPSAFSRPATNQHIPVASPLFSITGDHHHHQSEAQNLFLPDNFSADGNNNGGNSEYNLNFTISSGNSSGGLSGFNRGTLQSNSSSSSPSLLQRFPSSIDGSSPGFFIGTVENHNQFLSQLCYGDAHGSNNTRLSAHKGKGKN